MAVTFLTNEDEKKYVKTINDTAPDENGNIVVKGEGIAYDNTVSGIDATTVQGAIDKLSGGNVDQSGGLNATASALLITILRNGVYSTNQSTNITALEAALASGGGSDEPDTPDIPDVPVEPDEPDEPGDSGETSDILYKLAQPTNFNGTNGINTDVVLTNIDDYSVVIDFAFEGTTTQMTVLEGNFYNNAAGGHRGIGISTNLKFGTYRLGVMVEDFQDFYSDTVQFGTTGTQTARVVATKSKSAAIASVYCLMNGIRVEKSKEITIRSDFEKTANIANDFVGTINNLTIYNRVLTSDEIEAYLA